MIEIHLNLNVPQSVKLFREGGDDVEFGPVSAGQQTYELLDMDFPLVKRPDPTTPVDQWGLQYFAVFCHEVGFHSDVAYPLMGTLIDNRHPSADPAVDRDERVEVRLIVDGKPRSNGCIRMHHEDAVTLYESAPDGTRVFVYDDPAGFRRASWAKGPPVRR